LSNEHKFEYLKGKRTISLTTYYKSGKAVATPVEFVRSGEILYVSTRKASYKVKRIRNNSNATIAPCTMRGKITGPQTNVQVRILPEEEENIAKETIKTFYQGFFTKILSKIMSWRNKDERVYLEIN